MNNLRSRVKHYVLIFLNCLMIRKIFSPRHRKYFLSAVIIVKNESDYIVEWIEYHLLIGVEHFYVYDNQSTDNLLEVLQPYIESGIVTYTLIEGKKKQIPAYVATMKQRYMETKWLAILDADEFIVPVGKESLQDFLKKQSFMTSQLLLGWMVFGSSGKLKKEPGLVLDRFRWHASNDFLAEFKPIVRPERYLRMKIPHWVDVFGKTVDESGEEYYDYPSLNGKITHLAPKQKFRINHYYSKSLEEFQKKSARGRHIQEKAPRNISDFKEHDQNIERDDLLDDAIKVLNGKLRSN